MTINIYFIFYCINSLIEININNKNFQFNNLKFSFLSLKYIAQK